jgi:glutathione S-transferase
MTVEALLYDLQGSPACAKARICLQLKGLSYRRVPPALADVLRGDPRVPRLCLGDGVVVDDAAIAPYLDEMCPAPSLVPDDPAARAYCALLEGWADASLGGAVRTFLWGPAAARERTARRQAREIVPAALVRPMAALLARRSRVPACDAEEAQARVREHLYVLDAMLGDRPFLLGRTMTRADVAAFAQIACALRASDALSLAGAPAVAAWLERLGAVPAIETALVP